MKVTKQETLYHEDHGATLKHKCGKKIVTLSLLSFSLIFFYFFIWVFSLFLWPLFIYLVRSLIPTCGGIIVSIILSSLGQCSKNKDHHTFMDLQLKARTRYDSIWMPPAVYRDMQWIKSDMYERIMKVALPQIQCQLHDHAKAVWQWWSVS